jgi:hypothetical protein
MTRSDEREQERNPVDMRDQWEVVKRKVEEIFGTARSGGGEGVPAFPLRSSVTRGDQPTNMDAPLLNGQTSSSVSVTLVSLDDNSRQRRNDISDHFETNFRGSKVLRHNWELSEIRAERKDGAWEIGQERWRGILWDRGYL